MEQGGLSINGEKVLSKERNVTLADFDAEGQCLLKKGKKTFHRVVLK